MGVLDDLIGGLAGQTMGGQSQAPRGGQGGMGGVLMALMPVVLSMLANRGSQPGGRGQMNYVPDAGGGGLGDILGQVLGGAGGRGGAAGGLGGLLEQLQRTGYGEQANSWVARGPNKPIPPDAMSQIFGSDGLEEISRRAGVSEEEASRGLSQLLPEVVDRVTPNGEVPDFDALVNSVDDLNRRMDTRG